MNFSCHIRNVDQLDRLGDAPENLMQYYAPEAHSWPGLWTATCTRIYLGDEFCIARMPSLRELQLLGDAVSGKGLALTLLTPVMTDRDIEEVAPLFAYLAECHPDTEVVFNDWGVMMYLTSHHPSLNYSAGRVLNKGFKDPRLKVPSPGSGVGETETDELLNWTTFDGSWIQDQLQSMGIDRLERDLLPYREDTTIDSASPETSIYFPFGYVTSGRICWTASFEQSAEKRYTPPVGCSRPCSDVLLELKNSDFAFRIFQSGNTIFYLYPPERLDRLMQTALHTGLRLVYQGLGFETP